MQENQKICFVISPIGQTGSETRKRADQVLKHIIKPCLKECGFDDENIIRADLISDPGAITHQIINYIVNSELVIADLTEQNANVYYELAIRHLIRKPYVQICDINTPLPFDVKNQRTIIFDYKDLDSAELAKNSLYQSVKALEQNPEQLMTPIHEGLKIEQLLQSEKPDDRILGELVSIVNGLSEQVNRLSKSIADQNKQSLNTNSIVLNSTLPKTYVNSIPASINVNAVPPPPGLNMTSIPVVVPKPPQRND